MSDRVWKQLTAHLPNDPSAASDTVLRMALTYWVDDPRAALTPEQRGWLRALLAKPKHGEWRMVGTQRRQKLKRPLLDYLRAYHPELVERVAAQFS